MREVAELAGVAVSSVSRVLSDHPDVSPAMHAKVTAAAERLGYQPDLLAQSLRRRVTRTIGFVVGDISNPLLAEIALGAETTLGRAGYSMLLTNSENDPRRDARHTRLLVQRRVDGLLLSLAAEDDPETLAALARIQTPVVAIDRELPPALGASAALSDHRSGMRAAVEHLIGLGHRDIALIVGQPLRFSRERRRGLEEAFAAAGLPPTYRVLEGRLVPEHGRSATNSLLDDARPPTALVAGGNQILTGMLGELARRDVRIGRDISVVSCDAVPLTELFAPPIAVVRRDNRALGEAAAQLLLDQLGGASEPSSVVLPTEFVARASCGPPVRGE
ncbi:MAG: LacI family DNA-binding transcriptional regulator [Solirubrobacteraceae bacterium]